MIEHRRQGLVSRRTLLQASLAGGVVAWAGYSAWANGRGNDRPRLAVIMLQGGMDGLSLAPPLKDDRYHALRGPLAINAPLSFTADLGLHPALPELARMARLGQVRVAPAAASPTRSRAHSTETEVVLAGLARPHTEQGGWLNRALAVLAPPGQLPAVSLDAVASAGVLGPTLFGSWAPGLPALAPDLGDGLRSLYKGDDQLSKLLSLTQRVQSVASPLAAGLAGGDLAIRAGVVGKLFAQDDGPAAAFLSSGGFDTHENQGGVHGQLADRLRELDQALAALRDNAGSAWSRTMVVLFTEFGRTAATNGTNGTDHGVASTAFLVGGAVKPGSLIGDWPTLGERALHEGRELAPTLDLRSLLKGVLADHWGLSSRQLEDIVFPDSTTAPAFRGLVA